MTHQYIEVAESDGVLTITMDDSSTRNAIGDEMATEIVSEIDRLESDPDLRALVLTGRDPSFCSGANVRQMDQANRDRSDEPSLPSDTRPWDYFDQKLEELIEETEVGGGRNVPLRLHHLQKPSIAAVNGYAIGLGMGIALSCDIRIASENARFSETFIKRGLIPADGSCWQLPRIIGLSNTLLLQYTGDFVEADDAVRLGLVSRVTPHDELMDTTMELARRLAGGPTYTMGIVKKLVQMSLQTDFDESMRLAGPAQEIARSTEDHREGVRSFLEKRPPRFTGR
jgi:enoyl-CoA hydratase/carnithine racemase